MLKRVWCMLFTVLMLLALRPALGVTVKSKHTDEYFSTVSALFLYTEDSSAFRTRIGYISLQPACLWRELLCEQHNRAAVSDCACCV